jgi:hypothetical protein
VRVDIYETGSDDTVTSVDFLASDTTYRSDLGNLAVNDTDVSDGTRMSAAVDNKAAPNDQVERPDSHVQCILSTKPL